MMIRCAIVAAVCGLGVGLRAAQAADQHVATPHYKESVRLRVEPGQFAVFTGAAAPLGAQMQPHAWRGWWIGRSDRAIDRTGELLAELGGEFVSPVLQWPGGGPVVVGRDVFVQLAPGADAAALEIELAAMGAAILDRDWSGMPGVYRVRPSARGGLDVLAAASALAQRADVVFAEPDLIVSGRSTLIPNDPLFNQLWGLRNTGQSGGQVNFDMDADEAWDLSVGDASVITVILDVGVDQTHPDIHQIQGRDFTGNPGLNGGPGNQCDQHGTAVAGCVSARINNALGVVGVAPGTRTASARFAVSTIPCNGSWNTQISAVADAINWSVTIGARVTNNSNFFGFQSALVETAYANTRNAGVVHFASAGNSGAGSISYPSSIPTVNAVAALNRFGQRAGFSQFGPGLDFSAPGQDILTTDQQGAAGYVAGDYVNVNGTSFASPYAAGVAALVISRSPSLSAAQVEARLQQTSRDLGAAGYDTGFGWGLVNAKQAIGACYANCDGNTAPPFLSPADFVCFLSRFNAGQAYANCDGSTLTPALTPADFVCFLNRFRAGC